MQRPKTPKLGKVVPWRLRSDEFRHQEAEIRIIRFSEHGKKCHQDSVGHAVSHVTTKESE